MKFAISFFALGCAMGSAALAAGETLTISVYGFAQDEFKEALYDPFEEICDCSIVVETGNSVERMAKIEANAANPVIDMAVISTQDALSLARKDLIAPLDTGKLSNFDKLYGAAQDPIGGNLAVGYTFYAGAARPLARAPETAERILGPRGMQSRGRHLPEVAAPEPPHDAVAALAAWLCAGDGPRPVLALGPLTNLAHLLDAYPDAAARITRLVWMGGSDGPGNHSALAEFNALADPDAAAIVAAAGLPLDVVDLTLCRSACFGPADLPACGPLTADLLGGYLDIGLARGRPGMAIYDPLAALALIRPDVFRFEHRSMTVSTRRDETLGATRFTADPVARTRLATGTTEDVVRLCLDALKEDAAHGLSRRPQ